jgi:hypothetical protein
MSPHAGVRAEPLLLIVDRRLHEALDDAGPFAKVRRHPVMTERVPFGDPHSLPGLKDRCLPECRDHCEAR